VQVKAARGGSWQFGDLRRYCEITFDGHRQVVGQPKPCPVRRLVVVFVTVAEDRNDRFYILPWQRLRDLLIKGHVAYLRKHHGIRPQRWDSMHSAVMENALLPYRDQWETIERNLRCPRGSSSRPRGGYRRPFAGFRPSPVSRHADSTGMIYTPHPASNGPHLLDLPLLATRSSRFRVGRLPAQRAGIPSAAGRCGRS